MEGRVEEFGALGSVGKQGLFGWLTDEPHHLTICDN